jgi:hypothetical protein
MMRINIGLEGKYERKYIAWALDYPGCFGYGRNEEEAIINFPKDFLAYQNWINFKAGRDSWLKDLTDFDIQLKENFKNYENSEKKVVCSWFQNDESPLNHTEIDQAIKILNWSRKDLLDLWQMIPEVVKFQEFEGERWKINEIFGHVANAEWWYLDRLGLTECNKNMLPTDPMMRLTQVRENLIKVLPWLEKKQIINEVEGEIWSPRKIIRRACWHEKDHLVHIQKLIYR